MAAKPGELDFQKLAAEAAQELQKESSGNSGKKVKVAATEGGVPAPQFADLTQTDFEEPESEPEQVEEPDVEVPEDVETPEGEPSVEPERESPHTSEKKPKKLEDDDEVEVKIDGEVQVIKYSQYKDLLRKEATITQRMQNFAQTRKEFEAQVQNIVTQLEQREAWLAQQQNQQNPVQQALVDLIQGKQPAKTRSADEILTVADLQEELRKQQEAFENARKQDQEAFNNTLLTAKQQAQQQARLDAERNKFFSEVDKLMAKDEYKLVNEVVPHVKAHIMSHVNSVAPQNLEEALEASESWLRDRAAVLKKYSVAQEQKQQKIAVKQKMESGNGAPTTVAKGKQSNADIAKKFVMNNGKMNWKAMEKDALARMNSMN